MPAKKKKTSKKVVHARAVSHVASTVKKGHRHSQIFSDTTLMFLALFFALVGLLMVMIMKRQNDEFDDYVRMQQKVSQQQYRPMMNPSATPMMKKGY